MLLYVEDYNGSLETQHIEYLKQIQDANGVKTVPVKLKTFIRCRDLGLVQLRNNRIVLTIAGEAVLMQF